jgi:probable O-glycosylation ligase (exosortase A-associated)
LACLLIPVGTQARTGLICIAALAFLLLRETRRRLVYVTALAAALLIALPLLPQSYTDRMTTISNYQADSSASTRLAVWEWTWEYAQQHPFGGGFDAYRQNRLRVEIVETETTGTVEVVNARTSLDAARAYHSGYFEMLGEQGFPGLALFLLIHGIGLVRMEILRRRYRRATGEDSWISPLATALQNAQIIYLVGCLFVGIAWQPFIYMLVAVQIGFDTHVSRRSREARRAPFVKPVTPKPAPADA